MWWLFIAFVFLLVSKKILRHDGKKLPPLRNGWLPWLGCAIKMGKEPLRFINVTRKELGDIFTIHVAGKYITFVFGQSNLEYYFSSPHLSYKKAAQPSAVKAAEITKESFCIHNSSNRSIIVEELGPTQLAAKCEELSLKFHQEMGNLVTGEMDLRELVRAIMFPAVVKQMFGDNLLLEDKKAMLEFQNKFFKYDEGYEYGTELPEIFVREWRKSKQWLCEQFVPYVSDLSDRSTPFQKIIAKVHQDSAVGHGLLMLWTVQANVLPVAFWSLCHILSNPAIHKEATQEAKNVLPPATQLGDCPVTYHMTQQLSTIKRCVLEALRLCSPGIVTRKVTKSHTLEGYTIPKGHYVAISPHWEHRNPVLFPDPERFDPDRWRSCDLNNFQFLDGFVGFSGGHHQCPGRWFALTETCMIVAMVIHMFDLKLTTEVPQVPQISATSRKKSKQKGCSTRILWPE